jgi:hypothetical protein
MIVASVLKTGGEYSPCHVYNLRDMCRDFLPSHMFFCLTDVHLKNCEYTPLIHDWKGWWSKLELFRIEGPCLYFDLDTIIVGDCTDIVRTAQTKDFVILRDFYRGYTLTPINPHAMGSGMMYWSKSMQFIYDLYLNDAQEVAGDQDFIEYALRDRLDTVSYWQDICTGIVSYKAHDRHNGLQPTDKVVCFHGQPRPWNQSVIPYPNKGVHNE